MIFEVAHTWDGEPLPQPAATLHLSAELTLTVSAPLHNDPPPRAPVGPCWGLWEHEVVELFLLGDDERYLEVELGPHGHHLVLQLHGVRAVTARERPLDYTARIDGARWSGTATLPAEWLPPGRLRANAYAISGPPGARRYAAWAPVPGPAPDFHRLQHFRDVSL